MSIAHRFLLLLIVAAISYEANAASSFVKNFKFRGTKGFYKIYSNGTIQLAYTKNHMASFRSFNTYKYGFFTVRMKLPCTDTSGIVTTFFLSSGGGRQDEIDMEFLGHIDPSKIVLHTNVFGAGQGGTQEGFKLWFNPCKRFHKYTIWWNRRRVVWLVDDYPLRVHAKYVPSTNTTYPFPTRSMYIYGSIWNGSGWATQGGLIKPNFAHQPWRASYSKFDLSRTCRYYKPKNQPCLWRNNNSWDKPFTKKQLWTIADRRRKYLVYTYLT